VRYENTKIRALAAINLVRRGKAQSLSAAARTEGISVASIRKLFPDALKKGRDGSFSVRSSDPYSAFVEILTDSGLIVVEARGSKERELAGEHRSVYRGVLDRKLPNSALRSFAGETVGGHKLLSNPERLSVLVRGGELDQLDVLYVSPGARR
jgi:hypothetical protein